MGCHAVGPRVLGVRSVYQDAYFRVWRKEKETDVGGGGR
jgi:hypothetical protein